MVPLSAEQQERRVQEEEEEHREVVRGLVLEGDIEIACKAHNNAALMIWGCKAIAIARSQGIFDCEMTAAVEDWRVGRRLASNEVDIVSSWDQRLQLITCDSNPILTTPVLLLAKTTAVFPQLPTARLELLQTPHHVPSTRTSLTVLQKDQYIVHDIAETQLLKHLNNEPIDQLLMLCLGL